MTVITNTGAYPWDDVCYVQSTIGGITFQASGLLISPDEVLTAAHVVYYSNLGAATHVTVIPGYNDGREPFGVYTAANVNYYGIDDTFNVSTGQGSIPFSAMPFDFALIHLSTPVDSRTPDFKLGYGGVSSSGRKVHVTGYPASFGGEMINATPFVSQLPGDAAHSVLIGTALGEGSSGGPVWIAKKKRKDTVEGVVSAAIGSLGYFAELTSTTYNQILTWMREGVGTQQTLAAGDDNGSLPTTASLPTRPAANVGLLGSYMASSFPAAEGQVGLSVLDEHRLETTLARAHA